MAGKNRRGYRRHPFAHGYLSVYRLEVKV